MPSAAKAKHITVEKDEMSCPLDARVSFALELNTMVKDIRNYDGF